MMKIVFLPLIFGLLLQYKLPKINTIIIPYTSIISALSLYVVVLGISSNASGPLLGHQSILFVLFLGVFLQVLIQMGLGYAYGKWVGCSVAECRSMLFEVGICNSALATVLANETFGPLAGLASMANMICNLTLGTLFAAIFSFIPIRTANTHIAQ